MATIFGRFSRHSQSVLEEAQKIAQRLNRPLQTDMVLLSILSQSSSSAAQLLENVGATYTRVYDELLPVPNVVEGSLPGQTQEMQLLLEESIKLASRFRFALVETEHLLYTIARDDRFLGHMTIRKLDIDPVQIVNRLSEWLFSIAMLSQPNQPPLDSAAPNERGGDKERVELEKYTIDVTDAARNGELDPVIGREKEIEQMIQILLRRRKNNPLLLGEPGVGKTALVDALAERIVRKAVPKALVNKRILTLDLSLVVAGTMYRGQFEERLKSIIQEVQLLGNCILFVDEMHTLSGTGSAEGGFDAANILKPALARGEISLIGATTYEEYRKHIVKDKALDRRFQTIVVNEPSRSEAIQMLRGVKHELEHHHEVIITDDAIRSAVELSERYIHDRFLPDKAIDILDEAATYHAEEYSEDTHLSRLQQEIALVSTQKSEIVERATNQEDWDYAKALSEKETQLLQELQTLQRELKKNRIASVVTEFHVSRVIAQRTGIPLSDIQQTLEPVNVKRVQETLEKHLLGQDEAIKRISQALMRSQLGLQPLKKPIGSFLLVGPTGVGKTETARILAKQVFGDSRALIKIDMSEYMERHNVSNLIGAPAGYVGFDQGGSLTEQMRRRPYSVVLFDEVEKAHPDVFNLLLQILEDGVLTDNTGKSVSFEHALIIMTSNIGMASFNQVARIGFAEKDGTKEEEEKARIAELQEHIQRELNDYFRPEMLGRISATIFYNPLTPKVVKKLFLRRLKEFQDKLKRRSIKLEHTPAFLNWLTEQYNIEAGARSIDKVFLYQVEPMVIDELVAKPENKLIHLGIKDGTLEVTSQNTVTELHA